MKRQISCLLLAATCLLGQARAMEVNKCTWADGAVAYQDWPCPKGSAATTTNVGTTPVFLDSLIAARRSAAEQEARPVESTAQPMAFEDCLLVIQRTAAELGVAPVNIVETPQVRIVRFVSTDGSVLVTCSEPDQKMVLTKSPYH